MKIKVLFVHFQCCVTPKCIFLCILCTTRVNVGLSTQRDTSRHGPPVYPKRHPGQHHHQHGGKIRLKHEEEDVPPENEVYVEPIVPT